MTTIEDRPTIAERYTLAADGNRGTDVDMMVASGWCSERLGVMLLRLRGEFDGVKAEIEGQGSNSLTDRLLILAQLKTLREVKEALGDLAMKRAAAMNALPLAPMPTDIAMMKPWRQEADKRARTIAALAGRVLNAFLDPNCHPCNGVGKIGGYGAIQTLCRACHGSTKSNTGIGKTDAERHFAGHLLDLIERAASQAERGIAGNIQGARAARKMVSEVVE